jgi:hypothetical protein
LSADAKWQDRANPQAANLYAFALNNPYKYTDPQGEIPVLVVTAFAGAVFQSEGGQAICC